MQEQIETLKRSWSDPVHFVEKVFKPERVYDYQADVLNDLANHDRVAWRSGHGVGKTTTAAWALWWFLLTRHNSKVITTATAWRQVQKVLWPEVHHWLTVADLDEIGLDRKDFDPLGLMIKMNDSWFATGEASDDAGKLEGFHAPSLLYIVDEGKGVPRATYEAIDGALTQGGKILVISTPAMDKAGYFYDIFSRKVPGYQLHQTSSIDSPNVSKAWVESRKAEWGEDNPVYITRVLGDFADAGENHLIPLSSIEGSLTLDPLEGSGDVIAGLDVARFGEDKTAIVFRRGNVVIDIEQWGKTDTMETVGKVINLLKKHDAAYVAVDVIGVGAGVVDRLDEQGVDVFGFNSAEKADNSERYLNKRAEMWDGLKQRFLDGDIRIPDNETLVGQLSNIKYKYNSRGQLQIESKEEVKKRGLKSPDIADALGMCFYPEEFFNASVGLTWI